MLDGSRGETKGSLGCAKGIYGETLQAGGVIGRRYSPCGVLHTLRGIYNVAFADNGNDGMGQVVVTV